VGEQGERTAAQFLVEKGFRILQRNYRCRTGEIDLVAEDRGTLVFVEVKTRVEDSEMLPEAALTHTKKKRICRAAREFMKVNRLVDRLYRVDLVGIEYRDNGTCRIHHWQNVVSFRRALARWR